MLQIFQRLTLSIYKTKKVTNIENKCPNKEAFQSAFYALNSPTRRDVIELVKKHKPTINENFSNQDDLLNYKSEKITIAKARSLLREYTERCKYLLYALSGLRSDELCALHRNGGVESVVIEGQEIHQLKANMSKVTGNTQARQDIFVTTDVGKKAYEVLNEIMSPFRKMRKPSEQGFFHIFYADMRSLGKSSVATGANNWVNKVFSEELVLDEKDMQLLNISDPGQSQFTLGDTFHITPHMLRRSFAYYLIGYELLSFPQLKQQFSHYSLAMTRHYAKNASKFQKWRKSQHKSIYDEVQGERVNQKAQIYLNIYEKLANNERVAGGKGKAFVQKMLSGEKENMFTDRKSGDMLSLAYWENAIIKKKRHLHVVAPGVICTSTSCSMRTTVSFLDCVDCDSDFVIDAVFAEANRKSAEINMHYDIEHGELSPQSASESYKKIVAAQRVMGDLGLEYEPVVFPPEVKDLLIEFVEI